MSTDNYPNDPVTASVAAKRLGIHKVTIWRYWQLGAIRGWLVGPATFPCRRRLMVSMSEVMAKLTQAATPRSDPPKRRAAPATAPLSAVAKRGLIEAGLGEYAKD